MRKLAAFVITLLIFLSLLTPAKAKSRTSALPESLYDHQNKDYTLAVAELIQQGDLSLASVKRAEAELNNRTDYDYNSILAFDGKDYHVIFINQPAERTNYIKHSATNSEKDFYKLAYAYLLEENKYQKLEPNYLYHFNWTRNGFTDTPDDFDQTPTADTGNHWYYELEELREMWFAQDCLNAGALCGGDSQVVVAMIDSGLAFEDRTNAYGYEFAKNPELFDSNSINLYTNNLETPNNQVDDDLNGYVDDYNGVNIAEAIWCDNTTCNSAEQAEEGHPNDDLGHGTYTTGMIASLVDNSAGSVGAAHNITILPIKTYFFREQQVTTTAELVAGIDYAIEAGADIINMSISGVNNSSLLEDKLDEAETAGIITIAAAGNAGVVGGNSINYPAKYDSVISVGAVNADGSRSSYSSYGPEQDFVAYVGEVEAAGSATYQSSYTCFFASVCDTTFTEFGSDYLTGTSFAAPQVSALAAIILSENSSLTKQEVYDAIKRSATDLQDEGHNSGTGWGAINYYLGHYASTHPLAITVTEPDGTTDVADTGFTLGWDATGVNFEVNAYWDTDTSGYDGRLIDFACSELTATIADQSSNCDFNTAILLPGDYYVYVCIQDRIEEICEYSPNPITVTHDTVVKEFDKAGVTTEFTTVNFTESFSSAPVVIAEISSDFGTEKIYPNLNNVSTNSFEAEIEENTAYGLDNRHLGNEISWLAVGSSTYVQQIGLEKVDSNWYTVTFQQAFFGVPKVFAQPQTNVGGEIAYVNIRNVTTTGFEMRLEEPLGFNGTHGIETVGWIAFTDDTAAQEATATGDEAWTQVIFPTPYPNKPAVITSIVTENGADKAYVDIRALQNTGFQFRIEEEDGSNHTNETIAWAAYAYTPPQSIAENILVDSTFDNLAFRRPFNSKPQVFAQVLTANETDTVDVEMFSLSRAGYKLRLEEDPLAWDGNHANEIVSLLQISSPYTNEKLGVLEVNQDWQTVNFPNDSFTFNNPPQLFVEIQTNNGKATVGIDVKNITAESFEVRLEEDTLLGWDGRHSYESVAWYAFETPTYGQSGVVSTNHLCSSPVAFSPTYSGLPVFIADINSENGGSPVQPRVCSISGDDFTIMVEEELLYNGTHAEEDIAWLSREQD